MILIFFQIISVTKNEWSYKLKKLLQHGGNTIATKCDFSTSINYKHTHTHTHMCKTKGIDRLMTLKTNCNFSNNVYD